MGTKSTTRDGALLSFTWLYIRVLLRNSWDPIIRYIKDQHSNYLRKELTAIRDRFIQDTRIHCCLYFINPTGHGLRPVDVIVMKKLSEVVNVVPVIAKSDSLTIEERLRFKAKVRQGFVIRVVVADSPRQIREELVYHNIRLYPFDTDEDNQEEVELNATIRVGSSCVLVRNKMLTRPGHYSLCYRRLREQRYH